MILLVVIRLKSGYTYNSDDPDADYVQIGWKPLPQWGNSTSRECFRAMLEMILIVQWSI